MKRIHLLLALSIILLLALAGSGAARQTGEPDSSDPRPQPPGTAPAGGETDPPAPGDQARVEEPEAGLAQSYNASVRIPVAALKPRASNVEWAPGGQGGCTYASSGDIYTWWSAPLYLPQGSTLRYFRMYYNDQNATVNCTAYLTVYDLYGQIAVEWGIASSATGQSYVTTEQMEHVVDYEHYAYVINWQPSDTGTDMQVCGFRVYYQKPNTATYLPSVSTNY